MDWLYSLSALCCSQLPSSTFGHEGTHARTVGPAPPLRRRGPVSIRSKSDDQRGNLCTPRRSVHLPLLAARGVGGLVCTDQHGLHPRSRRTQTSDTFRRALPALQTGRQAIPASPPSLDSKRASIEQCRAPSFTNRTRLVEVGAAKDDSLLSSNQKSAILSVSRRITCCSPSAKHNYLLT